jgi:hypothetical protein|tara:strand:+ start:982 stop:1206 length:225 start_codon:yes stop_codon:yes gene_type:complete
MILTIKSPRKDGKFPVTFGFSGGPNGFGGLNYGKSIGKLYSSDQVIDAIKGLSDTDSLQDYTGQNLSRYRSVEL